MSNSITENVKKGYGAVAKQGLSSDNEGISNIAKAFGYSEDELTSIPAEANMGLSCGNPTAMASIKEGEVVVDLGSGGGLDVFLAAQKVGATGKAIGIDMTQDMIALAEKNAKQGGYSNTEFHLAEIINMPLEDDSVDCIISNCVLNLVEDKPAAIKEIFRVLKPGGRLAISDIALTKELPDILKDDVAGWNACFSGAIAISENERMLKQAGFGNVDIQDAHSDLNAYMEGDVQGCCAPVAPDASSEAATGCCGTPEPKPAKATADTGCCSEDVPAQEETATEYCDSSDGAKLTPVSREDEKAYHEHMANMMKQVNVNDFASSVKIFAIKPASS